MQNLQALLETLNARPAALPATLSRVDPHRSAALAHAPTGGDASNRREGARRIADGDLNDGGSIGDESQIAVDDLQVPRLRAALSANMNETAPGGSLM